MLALLEQLASSGPASPARPGPRRARRPPPRRHRGLPASRRSLSGPSGRSSRAGILRPAGPARLARLPARERCPSPRLAAALAGARHDRLLGAPERRRGRRGPCRSRPRLAVAGHLAWAVALVGGVCWGRLRRCDDALGQTLGALGSPRGRVCCSSAAATSRIGLLLVVAPASCCSAGRRLARVRARLDASIGFVLLLGPPDRRARSRPAVGLSRQPPAGPPPSPGSVIAAGSSSSSSAVRRRSRARVASSRIVRPLLNASLASVAAAS